MSRWNLYRLDSTDGTNNFLSWFLVFAGIGFFIFCVICGSLLTPYENIPQIVMFFFTGGAALVASFFSLFKLLITHQIRMSQARSDNDAEMSMDFNLRVPRTDPWPINETRSSPQSSLTPTLSLETRQSPTDSLLGLNSDDSLKSRSWRFLPSECRFRRAFSCDSSVSPYAYGTFQTVESASANEAACSTQVKHPIYAVPNKTVSKKGITIPISGLVRNQDSNHNSDSSYSSCSSSLAKLPTPIVPNKNVLKNGITIARYGSGIIANKDSNCTLDSSYNGSSSSLVINRLYAVPNKDVLKNGITIARSGSGIIANKDFHSNSNSSYNGSSSSQVKNRLYAVTSKVVLGTDLTVARSRSGLVEPPDFHFKLGSSCSSSSSSDKITVIENGNSSPVPIQSSEGDSSENDGTSSKPISGVKDASIRKLKQKRRDKKLLSEVLYDTMVKKPQVQVSEGELKSKQISLKSILRVPSTTSDISAFGDQLQSESYGNI